MITYADKERERYWPVSKELMAQYNDGSHTYNDIGSIGWQQNGLIHRDGDKPAFIGADGSLAWCQNGEWHRDDDKPAWIDADGSLVWYQNDKRHRFGGPAEIWPDGQLEWWINGREITQEVRTWLNRKRWKGTPEQIVEFKLRFA